MFLLCLTFYCHIYAEAEIHSQSVPGVPPSVVFDGLAVQFTWSQIGHLKNVYLIANSSVA